VLHSRRVEPRGGRYAFQRGESHVRFAWDPRAVMQTSEDGRIFDTGVTIDWDAVLAAMI
jgi:hypothetical protein